MSKKKKIGIIIIVILLLVGAGGYVVYTRLTDYVIANMFEAILVEDLEEQGILVTNETSTNNTQSKEATQNQADKGTTNNPQPIEGTPGQAAPGQATDSTKTEQTTHTETNGTNATITKVDIQARVKDIVKSIPVRDKNAVMRLIAQNISSSDMSYLSSLVTDGNISGSDIAKAKEIALRSFTPEQLEDVKYYYYKYIGMFSELYN